VPRVFRWRVPVWQADLDTFGEVRSSVLLRFLQETATRASTDAGFDALFYERAGTMWLVRRTALALLAPARYGDEIEARTWIADFRRVRSRRDYEIRSADRLIARAHTDWVYVDRLQSRPRRIPDEMQRAFVPDGRAALERPPFPDATPPAWALVLERRIELHELDALHHVNNANYVHYLEQAALDAAATVGWPLAEQLAAGGRFRTVAHDLEYLEAALYGEVLSVVSWPDALTGDTLERRTWIRRPGAPRPLLRATSRYAWVDVKAGEARVMPAALRAALAPPSS
jgi:acyl-CoA thioester hydrolase